MKLKIRVFRSTNEFVENKTCFNGTMSVEPDDFSHSNLMLFLKILFGYNSIILIDSL